MSSVCNSNKCINKRSYLAKVKGKAFQTRHVNRDSQPLLWKDPSLLSSVVSRSHEFPSSLTQSRISYAQSRIPSGSQKISIRRYGCCHTVTRTHTYVRIPSRSLEFPYAVIDSLTRSRILSCSHNFIRCRGFSHAVTDSCSLLHSQI